MNKLIEINVPGGTIFVESSEANGHTVRGAGVGKISEKAGASLSDALSVIRPMAEATMDTCRELRVVPTEVEVQFGLKFSASAGIVIASAATEGNLQIKLVWNPH